MSTVKANTYQDASGGSNAILYGAASPAGSMGFRNRIINGDMRIDQRNAGASVSTSSGSGVYTVDRWIAQYSATSKFTIQQSSTAPTGFTKSVLITSSAATSVGSGDYYLFAQRLEGFNTADLGFGTANAKTITISFWVRSSLTGTFGGSLTNDAQDRSYPFTYTISSANTFEYKSVTIPGDTTGTWATDNNCSFKLWFGLGVGSSSSGTANAWAGTQYLSATGATSVVGTNGATFYITGVQLEVGSVATEFERRPYGMELALCQRYYFSIEGGTQIPCYQNTSSMTGTVSLPVPMRAVPSISRGAGDCYVWSYNTFYSTSTTTMTIADHGSTSMQSITNTGFSGMGSLTVGVYQSNSKIYLSAEL